MATYSSIKQAVSAAANVARVVATNYDSIGSLPTSGNVLGEQALVVGDSSTDRLYVWEGSGWYQIALIQNSPTLTTSPDAAYELATDGVTTTVITLAATDPEGFPITFSATTNIGFDSIATVSNDSSVFTITPLSEDSAGVSRSGTITFKASDGISVASAISTFTITFRIENANFTTMLLKASGNNGTNTTINDASSNTHSITVSGNSSAQAFTPYHAGGYSAYFDGSGDFLSIADSTDFTLGTSNFTAECWIYPTASPSQPLIFGQWSNPYAWAIQLSNNSSRYLRFLLRIGGYVDTISTNTTVPLNEWSHLALVRNGSTFTLYFNGFPALTVTNSGSINDSSSALTIGGTSSGGQPYQGYIKDARFVVGDAVYTSNFTPPTSPLTSTGSNTKLLTCHLPYFADGSSSNHSITPSGNTQAVRFSPYDFSKYSPSSHGASVHFDGSGDFLSIPDTATTEFGSGDFTLEMWYNGADTDQYATLTAKGAGSFSSGNWALMMNHSVTGDIALYVADYSTGGPMLITGDVGIDNQWNHIAVVRNGNNWNLYVNGVSRASRTSSITIADTSSAVYIGKDQYYGRDLSGFISDYRIVKGTAIYTSNFTPPTTPLTAISGTSYLTCNDAPNIFNAAGVHTLPVKLFGGAKSSTSQNKNASSAMFFDGSGDYITSEFPALGTDDFTIEFWIRPDTINSNFKALMDTRTSNTNNPLVWIRNNNVLYLYSASGERIVGTTYLTTDTWYHVALVRNNGVSQLFLNGVQEGSDYADTNNYTESTLFLGQRYTGTAYNYNGHMEDFRITKGRSLYPFLPPEETLTSDNNTSLLIAHANTFTDGSSNSHSVSNNGSSAISNFGPHPNMKSIYLDGGSGHHVSISNSTDFQLSNYASSWQMEYYVYSRSASGLGTHAACWDQSSGADDWLVAHNSSDIIFYIVTHSNSSALVTASSVFEAYKWYHVAIVNDTTNIKIYVNGTLKGSASTPSTTTISGSTFRLGRYGNANNDGPFNGYISNFKLVKGSTSFVNSFTPPTAELKA